MMLQNPQADLRKKEKLPAHFSSECVNKKGIQGSRGPTQLKKSFCIAHFVSVKSFWEVLPQQRFEFRSTVIPKVQEFRKVIKYVLPERGNLFHGECSCPPLCGRPPALTIWGPVARSFYGVSGRSSTCQVAYFSLGVCGLHGIPVREGKPVVAALPWLSTNIGSRHATLAAKKAWIQWSTAKRLENSSSWKTETSGGGRVSFKIINFTAGCLGVHANRNKMAQEHPNTLQANKQFPFSFSKLVVRVPVQDFSESERHTAARVSLLWLIQIGGTIHLKISKWLRPLKTGNPCWKLISVQCLELNICLSGG